MKKLPYSLVLSCSLFLLLSLAACKSGTKGETVAPSGSAVIDDEQKKLDKETFAAAIKKSGSVVIDLRMPPDFEQSHIEGAININFFDPEFKYKLLELDKNKTYYLYEKGESSAMRSLKFMEDNAFTHVFILKDGYRGWNTAHADDEKKVQ